MMQLIVTAIGENEKEYKTIYYYSRIYLEIFDVNSGNEYFNHNDFLTEEELNLLMFNYPDDDLENEIDENDDESVYYNAIINSEFIMLKDPDKFKNVLIKLYVFLEKEQISFPLNHWIQEIKDNEPFGNCSLSNTDLIVNGVKCALEGDTIWYEKDPKGTSHREDLQIKSYWEDSGKLLFWIKAEPLIEVSGKRFEIRTQTKFDLFKPVLDELITFCDFAILNEKKILWRKW